MMRGPCGVYRLFDSEGVLLYIGSSRNPDVRVSSHLGQGSGLFGADEIRARTTQHTIVMYPSEAEAQQMERAAIYAERPLFNRMHNVKRFLRIGKTYFPVDYAVWPTGPTGKVMARMAELGLTWEQVGRSTRVTNAQLGHIAQRRLPLVKPDELRTIAGLLGLQVSDLLPEAVSA